MKIRWKERVWSQIEKKKEENKERPGNLAKLRSLHRSWAGWAATTTAHASTLLRRGEKASIWITPGDHRDTVSQPLSCRLPWPSTKGLSQTFGSLCGWWLKTVLLSKVSFVKYFLGRENVWDGWKGSSLCWSHKEPCCVLHENTGFLFPPLFPLAVFI